MNTLLNLSFNKNSKKQIRDLLEYNSISQIKLRHKTEDDYNQIVAYRNFYTTEIDFGNEKKLNDVKFSKNKSNFTDNYWENQDFPNMQKIFSQYFKDDLKQK